MWSVFIVWGYSTADRGQTQAVEDRPSVSEDLATVCLGCLEGPYNVRGVEGVYRESQWDDFNMSPSLPIIYH